MFDLSTIEWRATGHEGIFLSVLRRDERTGDATVFIKMEQGRGYPAHRHKGPEEVLVLQCGYRDRWGEHRAGDYLVNEPDSTHHPVALEGPDPCVLLAIAHGGIEIKK